jgi:drug/metabolite transporter (DMT)-like permease
VTVSAPRRSSPLAVAGLVLVALTLGSGHVCARLAYAHGVDVATAATLRAVCACLVLLALLARQGHLRTPRGREWRAALALGALVVAQTACIQVAIKCLPVALAILVFYTYPFVTSVGMAATGQEPLSARVVIALIGAFAGLSLVLGVGAQTPDPVGLMAGFGAAGAFAAILVFTPLLAPGLSASLRTFFMMALAAAVLGSGTVAIGGPHLPAGTLAWVGLAGLAVFYALGIVGLFLLLPYLGAVQTAVVLNLEPVAVALIAFLALGEKLTGLQLLGAAIVVTAVIYFQAAGRRTLRPAQGAPRPQRADR